ncbi:hypothetical protein VTN00DRAFT_2393 [Thermoascus crustaceus]|uniref:uncharacterized protein n=1 Tax=Thermoascus crustaceus TaxID=5088 RepID=UPI0037422165
MSLYLDAAAALAAPAQGGSFKARVYNNRGLRSSPAQVVALVGEASKWDVVLKEVIENADVLRSEPKLTPLLALLLTHDLLLSRDGVAAPASHPLRQAIERHKTRLRAEFVKARVRRGCASVEALRAAVLREKKKAEEGPTDALYPRWVRVNNLRTSLDRQLESTFKEYRRVERLRDLAPGTTDGEDGQGKGKALYVDEHVPDLLAVPPGVDLTASAAYRKGEIILQDKASCFPAYLLLGDGEERTPWYGDGDLVDGCAAPGNKTTHMASLLHRQKSAVQGSTGQRQSKIFSMDASPARSKTLQKMVARAGADGNGLVTVLAGQDFLALDPEDERFANVKGLLLDPSCSGSGIIGRDDVPVLALPVKPGAGGKSAAAGRPQGKKRKRQHDDPEPAPASKPTLTTTTESETAEETKDEKIDTERLTRLSNLQFLVVQHALRFPSATRVTYSTCSIHILENEAVVARILASDVARERGWRALRREEQPRGMREWKHRGIRSGSQNGIGNGNGNGNAETGAGQVDLSDEDLDACLRCWPGDEQGTGGFFVVGFVRDESLARGGEDEKKKKESPQDKQGDEDRDDDDEEEWEGFSD